MIEHIVTDDFGRRTVFTGEPLVSETSDSTFGDKPQWLEVDVWRTQAGNFVVRRTTRYRVRHRHDECARADGYDLTPATESDTYACPYCNRGDAPGGFGQAPRISVDTYTEPESLILGFQNEGRYSNLARAILAELSEQDERVNAAWNTVVVP